MSLRKEIKNNAKRCLYTNWGKAISIVLLGTAIYLLFSITEVLAAMLMGIAPYEDVGFLGYALDNVPNVSIMSMALTAAISMGTFLVITPLNLGITGWYWKLSDGESEDILNIFHCFANGRMFCRSLWLNINIALRCLLWAVLLFSVPVAVIVYCAFFVPPSLPSVLGGIFGWILAAAATAGLALTVGRYFLARYCLLDGETKVRAAIKKSVHATKGARDEILIFHLSYTGWFLLGLLVIPWLYVKPYYDTSCVLYARYLLERAERRTQLALYCPPEEEIQPEQEPPANPEEPAAEELEEPFAPTEDNPFATRTFDVQDFHKTTEE